MADDSGQDKTEPATAKRREKEREEGNVPKSKEINTVVMLGAAFWFFVILGGQFMHSWISLFQKGLKTPLVWKGSSAFEGLYTFWAKEYLSLISPLFALFIFFSIYVNYAQVGWLVSWKSIKPKPSKLNPIKGIKSKFSYSQLIELIKSLFKILFLAWIVVEAIKPEIKTILVLFHWPIKDGLLFGASLAYKIIIRVWLAVIFMAILDLIFQRWNYERKIKMTKQEVQDEVKQQEGDPKVKARIRGIQVEVARRRMMQEVPLADVVVTNPVHIAVALRYKHNEDTAPIVVAKGAGLLCERIKDLAREHHIPIIENPTLARLLYREVNLGQGIPLQVYKTVAEILAYVYRLKGKVKDGVVDG